MADSAYENVFLAVLSMDTYMRDWRGLTTKDLTNLASTDQIGTATVEQNSSVLGNVVQGGRLDEADQFFAQAYSDPTYGTIISYRGILGDISAVFNAVSIAGGAIPANVGLAALFYQKVVASLGGPTPFTADVTFTGHSLGGALAGIVSS
jgi:hypothetical protein